MKRDLCGSRALLRLTVLPDTAYDANVRASSSDPGVQDDTRIRCLPYEQSVSMEMPELFSQNFAVAVLSTSSRICPVVKPVFGARG